MDYEEYKDVSCLYGHFEKQRGWNWNGRLEGTEDKILSEAKSHRLTTITYFLV